MGREERISRRTGVPVDMVRKVLDEQDRTPYALGTVVRAYDGANMAILTPRGWVGIGNVQFVADTGYSPSVKGWEIVYDPDSFDHQSRVGAGDGEGELVK